MSIVVVNESKSVTTPQALAITKGLQYFSQQVTTAWGLPANIPTFAAARDPKSWNVCIVDQFPNPAMTNTALGYHEVVNGLPIAYIRANCYGNRNPLGTYIKPLIIRGKQITKAIMTPGMFSVICHELAEMLIDPNINRTAKDPIGRNWLMEICDHTVGQFVIPIDSANAIAPDFTTPAFYNINGKAPLSYLNVPTKPFLLPAGAYGYYVGTNGQPIPVSAAAARVPDVQ